MTAPPGFYAAFPWGGNAQSKGKGPPSTKNMHTKDGHDSRGRNYTAETQLPHVRVGLPPNLKVMSGIKH